MADKVSKKPTKLELERRYRWVGDQITTSKTGNLVQMIMDKYDVNKDTSYKYIREVRKEREELKKYANEIAAQQLADLKVELVSELSEDVKKSNHTEQELWDVVSKLKHKMEEDDDPKRYSKEVNELITTVIKNRESRQSLMKTMDGMIGIPTTSPETQVNIQNNSYTLKWGGDNDNTIDIG